jgi:hypothetical protein
MSYAHAFVTKWRNGALFDREGSNVVVSYDQKNAAYNIDPEDREDFESWIYDVFGGDETDPEEIAIFWDN